MLQRRYRLEKSYEILLDRLPQTDRIMIGRGILKNPALPAQLRQCTPECTCPKEPLKTESLKIETLKAFHDEIFEGYAAQMPGETPTLSR